MEFGENGAVISQQMQSESADEKAFRIHAFPDGVRSLKGLFRWANYLLKGYMLVEFVLLVIILFLTWLYLPTTVVPFDMATLEQIDTFIAGVGTAHFLLFCACAFIVAKCIYRGMKNLYTIRSKHAEMSPGWAVGWYFIPIANLFKPAEGMSQIVHGTRHAVGELKAGQTGIPLWWTCWLLTNITQSISDQIVRISGSEIDPSTQIVALSFDGASSVFGVLSAWALLRVLRSVVTGQEEIKHGGVAHVFD